MEAVEVEMEELPCSDPLWVNFVLRHVQIHCKSVSLALMGRDMEEAREIVLEWLDGYLVWLGDERRKAFKQSIYISTTFVDASLGDDALTVDEASLNEKERNREAKRYGLTTRRPKDVFEARKHLEAYFVTWRTLFTLSETECHAANRVAQLFDYEVSYHGPVFRLARIFACTSQNGDLHPSVPTVEDIMRDNEHYGIMITESDVADFYQDGMKVMEGRKANLDDLHESSTFRIKPKSNKGTDPRPYLPRLHHGWLRKTFFEPEGVKAGIVAMRNYYPILHFNIYLTLAAWAWLDPLEVTAANIILADGVASTIGCLLEIVSRVVVYPCRSFFKPVLPWWSILLWILSYLIGLGEVGLWVLCIQLKILSFGEPLAKYIYLGAFGAGVVIRGLHNLLLFFKFPTTRPKSPHHKYRATSCSSLNRLFWKCVLFLLTTTGILVPLYYWFVVPTLQRSAFWSFCKSRLFVTKIQCYIGIIGLWIPLLSVILIMDFIAYAIVLAFYGAYLAQANQVTSYQEEAFSVVNAFRTFSTLLRRWNHVDPNQINQWNEGDENGLLESPQSDSSSSYKKSKKKSSTADSTTDSSSSSSKKSKKKLKKSAASSADDSADMEAEKENADQVQSHKAIAVPMAANGSVGVESEFQAMMSVWYLIVDDLHDMDLISRDMAKGLYSALNWQTEKIGSKPKEIIQFFFSSLGALSPSLLDSLPANYLEKLPPLTQLIPSYGEAVIFDLAYLCNRENKPLSNLEFLVLKYPKEWKYFFQRVKRAFSGTSYRCYGTANADAARANGIAATAPFAAISPPVGGYSYPEDENEMLLWFLQAGSGLGANGSTTGVSVMHPDLMDEIRLWASLRGQTLYKTIRGTLSYRMALSAIYEVTNHTSNLANSKCQVILAHQQYGDPSILKQIANDVIVVFKKLSCPSMGHSMYGETPFDLVFDWSPRDLVAQDSFRRKLSQQQNEEIIRRYALKSIFNETEKICSFGESLKRLIDIKAGSCPIDPKQGFPFASILAGLPTATQIKATTWLFKYRGVVSDSLEKTLKDVGHHDSMGGGMGDYSHTANGMPMEALDDEFSHSSVNGDAPPGGRSAVKKEALKWDFVSRGRSVIHAPIPDEDSTIVDHTPAWLRFFNSDTGREMDFLLQSSFFDLLPIKFIRIPVKSLLRNDGSSSVDLASLPEEVAKRSSASSDSGSNAERAKMYAVIRFGIRGVDSEKGEAFAIVTALNEDRFDVLEDVHHVAQDLEDVPLSKVDGSRSKEIDWLQRALNGSNPSSSYRHLIDDRVEEAFFGSNTAFESVRAVYNVAAEYASQSAFQRSLARGIGSNISRATNGLDYGGDINARASDAKAENIFLGIEIKGIMPRRHPLIMRVSGEMPFGEADRIQGKAANQMNGLRFCFGLIIQTKDANQGGNVAEALKFPIILSKFEIHSLRDRRDQLKHIKSWAKTHISAKDARQEFMAALQRTVQFEDGHEADPTLLADGEDRALRAASAPRQLLPVQFRERSVPLEDSYERDGKKVLLPPVIIGFRESVFTRNHGAVARFQAQAEWAFGTIVQRVLSKLGLRMHYGHPDFFSASWVFSRSALSKANPVYNLSEDIFAGYMAMLAERRSVHTDKIQDEKGRDTALGSTYTFTAKLAQGAASQIKSRDVFDLYTRVDFLRYFLLFHSSLGYYFTTTAMLASVKMYLFGLLVFSLAGYSAENLGNLQFIYSVPFLVQVGMFTLLPLILEVAVEDGVWAVLKVIVDLPFSLGYFLFQGQTTCHHLIESFSKGKSHYEATGRLLGVSRKSLVDLYQLYGRSHFEPAMDYLFYVVVYYVVSSSRFGGYLPLFAPIICVVVFIIAPTGFQLGSSLKGIFNDIGEFGRWIYSTESFGALLKEWRSAPMREQMIKNLTWKATFKVTHTRLQTYSIFNYLKTVLSTHWRVDFATVLSQFLRVLVWGFIIVSVPGGMKDAVLKILIGFIIYIMMNVALAVNTPHSNSNPNSRRKKGCWHSCSNILFFVSIAYFVALFVILGAYRYLGDCTVGVFLSLKFLKSFANCIFHSYALVAKIRTSSKWRAVEEQANRKKVSNEEKDRTTKELKADLEKNVIAGLYLLETIDRPILMLSISVVVIPIHAVFSLLWAIPRLSQLLMYSISLKPKVNPEDLSRTPHNRYAGMFMGTSMGYNSYASPDDFNELPSFDFEDDVDVYY